MFTLKICRKNSLDENICIIAENKTGIVRDRSEFLENCLKIVFESSNVQRVLSLNLKCRKINKNEYIKYINKLKFILLPNFNNKKFKGKHHKIFICSIF